MNLKEMTKTQRQELLVKCGEIYHRFSKSEKYLVGFQNTDGNIYGVFMEFSDFWKYTKLDTASGSSNGRKVIIRANTGIKNLLKYNPFFICTAETWENTSGKTAGNKLETLYGKKADNKDFSENSDIILNNIPVQLKFFGKSASNVCSISLLEKLSGKSLI